MLTGEAPFEGASDYLIFTKVLAMEIEFPSILSPEAIELIQA
jgi:hypothetical protein